MKLYRYKREGATFFSPVSGREASESLCKGELAIVEHGRINLAYLRGVLLDAEALRQLTVLLETGKLPDVVEVNVETTVKAMVEGA